MTDPTQHNCEHQGEGWCLQCVGKLQSTADWQITAYMALQTSIGFGCVTLYLGPMGWTYLWRWNKGEKSYGFSIVADAELTPEKPEEWAKYHAEKIKGDIEDLLKQESEARKDQKAMK